MTNETEISEENLTKLDPAHIKASRISTAITMMFPILGAGAAEITQILPTGSFVIPVLIIAVYVIFIVPVRKYNNWGYHMGGDRIRIVRGYMFHADTIVPFGRIQHIDVEQGPIQRPYGLATLTVHTAGNHNSTVSLPGILHSNAIEMRDIIRGKIKQDII
jgi:uncharacterized protein